MVREKDAILGDRIAKTVKMLLAVEPRAYREAVGLAIENLRPNVEVAVSAPEDLISEVARLAPTLVICGLPDSETSEEVTAWVELQSPQGYWQKATVRIRDDRFELINVQLDDLLSIIDRTEEAMLADRPPKKRSEPDMSGR